MKWAEVVLSRDQAPADQDLSSPFYPQEPQTQFTYSAGWHLWALSSLQPVRGSLTVEEGLTKEWCVDTTLGAAQSRVAAHSSVQSSGAPTSSVGPSTAIVSFVYSLARNSYHHSQSLLTQVFELEDLP